MISLHSREGETFSSSALAILAIFYSPQSSLSLRTCHKTAWWGRAQALKSSRARSAWLYKNEAMREKNHIKKWLTHSRAHCQNLTRAREWAERRTQFQLFCWWGWRWYIKMMFSTAVNVAGARNEHQSDGVCLLLVNQNRPRKSH